MQTTTKAGIVEERWRRRYQTNPKYTEDYVCTAFIADTCIEDVPETFGEIAKNEYITSITTKQSRNKLIH